MNADGAQALGGSPLPQLYNYRAYQDAVDLLPSSRDASRSATPAARRAAASDQAAAATVLQAGWRRRLCRRRFTHWQRGEARLRRACAIKVQARARGGAARRGSALTDETRAVAAWSCCRVEI